MIASSAIRAVAEGQELGGQHAQPGPRRPGAARPGRPAAGPPPCWAPSGWDIRCAGPPGPASSGRASGPGHRPSRTDSPRSGARPAGRPPPAQTLPSAAETTAGRLGGLDPERHPGQEEGQGRSPGVHGGHAGDDTLQGLAVDLPSRRAPGSPIRITAALAARATIRESSRVCGQTCMLMVELGRGTGDQPLWDDLDTFCDCSGWDVGRLLHPHPTESRAARGTYSTSGSPRSPTIGKFAARHADSPANRAPISSSTSRVISA